MKRRDKTYKEIFILTKILLILAWSLLIIVIMIKPMPVVDNLEAKFTWYDKIVHIIMFGGLTGLLLFLGQDLKRFNLGKGAILIGSLAFGFSYFMEDIQRFIPGRMSDIWDLIFGSLGIVIAIFLYYIYFYRPKPKLLLHICCATCGAYVSQLLSQDFKVSLFYANPNIYPESEVEKRLTEVRKIAKKFRLKLIVDKYNHQTWLKIVKGHEDDPEKGARCHLCYEFRLKKTVLQAKQNGCQYFATTLSVSPHKLAQVINQKGEELALKHGLKFLNRDFKKQDGFKKSMELSKKFNFYRQDYCGCEFSQKNRSCLK